jgi:predicted hotdog family 3-hydroxylacyl-ACP dehydratase
MNNYPIEVVLPHDHPMILIDKLISYSEITACSLVSIHPKANFYNAQRHSVPSYVGLEYMAQTIAAYANAIKLECGGSVALGFLVSARTYKAKVSEFKVGAELLTSVERLFKEENGLSVFECSISQNNELLVEAKINVFEPEDPEQFLKEQA